MKQIKAKYETKEYPIFIGTELSATIELFLKNYDKKRVLFIVDKNILKILKKNKYDNLYKKYNFILVNSGVESKNIDSLLRLINILDKKSFSRDGIIVALGGGVIGDISALLASIYYRGINLVHIPTTMTSIVDSSIGGKTGINFNNKVNLLGSFYHPNAIFVDMNFILSLPNRDFNAGLCESIKKGFIYNKDLFNFIDVNYIQIKNRNIELLSKIIEQSINIKLELTSNDTYEKSNRLLLNFGHTFGQSIESYFKINQNIARHGEAVSIGMIFDTRLSFEYFNKKRLHIEEKLIKILKKYDLPIKIRNLSKRKINQKTLLNNIFKDKKRLINGSRFIIPTKIGNGKIITFNDRKVLKKIISSIL